MKKRKWTRVIAAALAFVFALAGAPPQVQAKNYWPKAPSVESESAILMEVNTGTVLYEKNSHDQHYPASITKIMTCLLAVENCNLDEIVVFSADAVYKNEGNTSNIARNLDEELTVEQCLYAVMLESANECAYALGEHVGEKLGGDYQTFIDLMNSRAKELGCTDTHFSNANGLPDETHVVSAYDMALISAEAYRNETFRRIAGAESYTLPKTNKCDEEYPLHNHHKMIYPYQGDYTKLYDYCTGGKTGYTNAARSTLVSYAEKDGITLVCVVLKAETPAHYTDTRTLFEFGFENFEALSIAENESALATDERQDFGLLNTNEPFVQLDNNAYIIMPKAAEFSDAAFTMDTDATEDGTVARLTYTYADRVVGSADIVKTGATVTDSYYTRNDGDLDTEDENIIWIRPRVIGLCVLAIAALVALFYGGRRLYDNFYLMRHQMEMRQHERSRFKEVRKKKRYRRKDRMFK
jgi:D-alanyl-D-alanine carboxypeptidase